MGAELWVHEAPWYPEPVAALRALQVQCLAEKYDLSHLLPQELHCARETVAATEAEGDPYDLLDQYRRKVAMLEEFCSRPLPQAPEQQIEILRKVCADSGQGIGNVLDVKGVGEQRGVHTAERLTEKEMVRLIGTDRPTLAQAREGVYRIHEELGRGESVCFPYYDDSDRGRAVGWYFVGNTID